jgi:hypothetical protein
MQCVFAREVWFDCFGRCNIPLPSSGEKYLGTTGGLRRDNTVREGNRGPGQSSDSHHLEFVETAGARVFGNTER